MRVREACEAIGAMLARCGAGGAMVCQPARRGAARRGGGTFARARLGLPPSFATERCSGDGHVGGWAGCRLREGLPEHAQVVDGHAAAPYWRRR